MAEFIVTYTGKRFNPFTPVAELIDPVDIAHALSNQCRYTGHTKVHYSVATHSCLVYDYLVFQGAPKETCEAGLMHDGAEAYLIDLPAPLKHAANGFGKKFQKVEESIEKKVAERFSLVYPWPERVKTIDLGLREDEIDQLFDIWVDREPKKRLGVMIPDWSPKRAEKEMLKRMKKHGFV